MKIFSLFADGPHRANIGIFTSKEKAHKAWRRFKYAYRGTVWSTAKKALYVQVANLDYRCKKV